MRSCPSCGGQFTDAESYCSRDGSLLLAPTGDTGALPAIDSLQDPLIGQLLGGRVRVVKQLGMGGMGHVYFARHELLDRDLAVKVVRRDLTGSARLVKRFLREARICSRLDDPHVVSVTDFGRAEDGRYYLVMEYLIGCGLDEVLRKAGPLPVARALHVARQAAQALATAHAWGVVHRDLKPQNIWLVQHRDERDFVKVLDFGLAKMAGGDKDTATGEMLGTPYYVAPEQIANVNVDHRSDIYALGIVLYEMLVGHPPFGGSLTQVLMAHQDKVPADPAGHRKDLPEGLSALVLRCLAKQQEERFQSALEVIEAIGAFGLLPPLRERVPASAPAPEVNPYDETAPAAALGVRSPAPATRAGRRSSLPSLELVETMVSSSTTIQSESPNDLVRLREHLIRDLVDLRWPEEGARPPDVQRLQVELRGVEAELEDRETAVAILIAEIEELEQSARRREASLRQAILDLCMDRTRLEEQLKALSERDPMALREWGSAPGSFNTGEIRVAEVDAAQTLRAVEGQVKELEGRLHEIQFELHGGIQLREQTMATRRHQIVALNTELEGLLEQLRSRTTADPATATEVVRRTVEVLDRIEKQIASRSR